MPGPDLDAARRRVEAFVLRARRVGAHSLARDDDELAELGRPRYKLVVYDGRDLHDYIDEVPPEEAVESLAARVRPFMLRGDPVFYGDVLKATKTLLWSAGAHDLLAVIEELQVEWRNADPAATGNEMGVFRAIGAEGESIEVSDRDLANGWFYADLVHADREAHPVVTDYSLRDRYRAAVARVALLALAARDTLAFVTWLHAEGIVALRGSVFEEEVQISELRVVHEGVQIFQGEEGAVPPQSAGEHLDGDFWRRVTIADLRAQWDRNC